MVTITRNKRKCFNYPLFKNIATIGYILQLQLTDYEDN